MTKKITLATLKSFVNKNKSNLLLKVSSSFSGMTDCIESIEDNFSPASEDTRNYKNTLGMNGVWLVGDSRDYFTDYEDDNYKGIKCSNCCGCFILAIKKAVL